MTRNLRIIPREIFIPKREVVKLGNRWVIYLPVDMNDLWRTIKEQGKKIRVYIEVMD